MGSVRSQSPLTESGMIRLVGAAVGDGIDGFRHDVGEKTVDIWKSVEGHTKLVLAEGALMRRTEVDSRFRDQVDKLGLKNWSIEYEGMRGDYSEDFKIKLEGIPNQRETVKKAIALLRSVESLSVPFYVSVRMKGDNAPQMQNLHRKTDAASGTVLSDGGC